MASVKMYKCVVGKYYTCYGKYLGKLVEIGSRPRDPDAGAAGQSSAPVYVFENETFGDMYPSPVCVEVEPMPSASASVSAPAPAPQSRAKTSKAQKSQKPILTY
jgi:hypothetical protein